MIILLNIFVCNVGIFNIKVCVGFFVVWFNFFVFLVYEKMLLIVMCNIFFIVVFIIK